MVPKVLSRVHPGNSLWYALPLALSLFALMAIAFDQGWIASTFGAESVSRLSWLHEFFHDARHAAGFPCH